MKLITTAAVTFAGAFAAAPAAAQYDAPTQAPQHASSSAPSGPAASAKASAPQVKPSSKAVKAIADLQDTVNKKDWASVPAKVAAAQAVASTKEDRYLIGSLQLRAAAAQNDSSGFASALDAIAQTGVVSPSTLASLYGNLAGTYVTNKQYSQAAAAYQKAIALDPNNLETLEYMGEAQAAAGQKAEAVATFQRAIQARSAAGQKPGEDLMKRAVGAAYEAKLPVAVDLARQWVAAYPSASSWSDALAIYSNMNRIDAEGRLGLDRLLQATGAMNNSVAYEQYVVAALDLNNYNEAQAALDAGIAAKLIDPTAADFKEIAATVRQRPKATVADLATATKEAVNGMALLRIGDRYYAMGDYAKAAELYRMAKGKADVDAALANLHIGMALARAGDKAGATAALNAVTGPRSDIAKYWLLYVNQKA
jgi:tetratricopeptide (TPR) repeat protein